MKVDAHMILTSVLCTAMSISIALYAQIVFLMELSCGPSPLLVEAKTVPEEHASVHRAHY